MKPMDVTPEVVHALAVARLALRKMGTDRPERLSNLYTDQAAELARAFATLDDVGLFAVVDEVNDYASAEEILAETYQAGLEAQTLNTADPAEWGDTTSADMARHQGYTAASGPGKLERVPGTDTLRPARLPEPEAVSDEWAARARAIENLRPTGRRSHGSLAADND